LGKKTNKLEDKHRTPACRMAGRSNVPLATGEQALVRLWRIER